MGRNILISSQLNDTYREKLYKNGWLAASDFFNMFTQSINLLSRIKSTDFEKPTSITWTRTLDPDPGNLDPEKHGP